MKNKIPKDEMMLAEMLAAAEHNNLIKHCTDVYFRDADGYSCDLSKAVACSAIGALSLTNLHLPAEFLRQIAAGNDGAHIDPWYLSFHSPYDLGRTFAIAMTSRGTRKQIKMQSRVTHTEVGPVVIVAREIASHVFENGTYVEAVLAVRYPSGKIPEFEIIYNADGRWRGFSDCDIGDDTTQADAWLIELLRSAIDWIETDSDLGLDVSYYRNWADGMAAKAWLEATVKSQAYFKVRNRLLNSPILSIKKTILVADELAKICGGKQPPIRFVREWLSIPDADGGSQLQAWVIDNTTTVDDETENLGIIQIDAAIKRVELVLQSTQ